MYAWLERLCSEQSHARGEGSICQGCAWVSTKPLWMTASFNLNPRSRSLKRIREAAQQFTLVARGLEGSNFGIATVTM